MYLNYPENKHEIVSLTSDNWHGKTIISIDDTDLQVCETIMGCGIMQIYGVCGLYSNKSLTKEKFLEALQPIKDANCGTIIATLGNNYYYAEDKLLELGFVKISEYPNLKHRPGDRQRLYILTM